MSTQVVGTKRLKVNDNNLFAQKKVMNAYIMLQIAFDEIECLTDTTLFKQHNKTRITNTISWLKTTCSEFTDMFTDEQNANTNKVVDQVRQLLRLFEEIYDKKNGILPEEEK